VRRPAVRVTPFGVAAALIVACTFAFYYWTADSGLHPLTVGHNVEDRYNLLADGFLHGQLSLRPRPPAGLTSLPNPYDPALNASYRGGPNGNFHDIVLYKDRFYLYFGPTPVVTLIAPFRVLGLGHMSESVAVWIYSCLGLLFALFLLRFLARRYVPDTPGWMKLVAIVGVAAGGSIPFILRRPVTYEAAIAAAYCFGFAALWLFANGVLAERRSYWRMALGSLCVGLCVGARADLFLLGLVPVALLVWLWRSGRLPERATLIRHGAALLGPMVAIGILLLVYNQLRFGSLTDFGAKWQLAGVDEHNKPLYQFSFLGPAFYFLFIAPARLMYTFPFFQLPPPPGYPGSLPVSYYSVEQTGGLLSMVPILWALFAVPFLWRKRVLRGESLAVLGGLLLLALGTAFLVGFTLYGITMRYEVDFATLLLVVAFVAWFLVTQALRPRRRARIAVMVVGTALVFWGTIYGLGISITGYDNGLAIAHPKTYERLNNFFRKGPTLFSVITRTTAITQVSNPTGVTFPTG